jgi:hypothetical protein
MIGIGTNFQLKKYAELDHSHHFIHFDYVSCGFRIRVYNDIEFELRGFSFGNLFGSPQSACVNIIREINQTRRGRW